MKNIIGYVDPNPGVLDPITDFNGGSDYANPDEVIRYASDPLQLESSGPEASGILQTPVYPTPATTTTTTTAPAKKINWPLVIAAAVAVYFISKNN